MGSDITALREKILPEVIALSKLVDPLMKVLVLEYKDYDVRRNVTRSSGWISVSSKNLHKFLSELRPTGGADRPEATKTAMNVLLPELDELTLVLHFADAEPHMAWQRSGTAAQEQKIYKGKDWDWCALSKKVRDSGASYYSLIRSLDTTVLTVHSMLGRVFSVSSDERYITNMAMGIILREQDIEHDLKDMKEFHLESQELPTKENRIQNLVGTIGGSAAIGRNSNGTLKIIKKFKSDELYRTQVLDILISIFTDGDIMCLASNALFGRLWNLCKSTFFDDKRLETAKNALSKAAGKLTGQDRKTFTEWQQSSYNQVDVIKDMYEQMDETARFPAYTLDPAMAQEIDIDALLDLSRGVAKPSDRKVLMKLINSIVVVESERELLRFHTPESLDDVPFVPLSLSKSSPFRPFQYLPHLLVPGMIFGRCATMQLLLLAVNSETFADEATSILQNNVGKWIQLSGFSAPDEKDQPNPAHFTAIFVRLVNALPSVLTDSEQRFYNFVFRLQRVTGSLPKLITLELPYSPIGQSIIMHDTTGKRRCVKCNHWRSHTLLTDGDVCGICVCGGDDVCGPDQLEQGDDCEKKSRFLECRTCHHFYAIVDYDALNVPPKCHYCRSLEKPPCTLQCDTCQNHFNSPTGHGTMSFRCGRCEEGSRPFVEREVSIKDLLEQMPRGLGVDQELFGVFSPFKIARKLEFSGIDLSAGDEASYARWWFEPEKPTSLVWNGKPVQNLDNVVDAIQEQIKNGRNVDECQLCFEELPLVALNSACGACTNQICDTCAKGVYASVNPGTLVKPITCPFCKRKPKYATLKRVRKELIQLRIPSKLDAGYWYALCRQCKVVSVYCEKECARGVPNITDFACEKCQHDEVVCEKQCPACGHGVEKVGGCDHVTCICGAHWCWICGEDSTYGDIYEHIYSSHGADEIAEGY